MRNRILLLIALIYFLSACTLVRLPACACTCAPDSTPTPEVWIP